MQQLSILVLKGCPCVGASLCSLHVPSGSGERAGSEIIMGHTIPWCAGSCHVGGSWGWRWEPLSRIGPRVYTSLNRSVDEFEGALGLGPNPAGVSKASGCPSHRAGRAGGGVGLTPRRKGPEPQELSPLQTTGPVSLTSSKPHSNWNLTLSP